MFFPTSNLKLENPFDYFSGGGSLEILGELRIECICVIAASFSRTTRSCWLRPCRMSSALMASIPDWLTPAVVRSKHDPVYCLWPPHFAPATLWRSHRTRRDSEYQLRSHKPARSFCSVPTGAESAFL